MSEENVLDLPDDEVDKLPLPEDTNDGLQEQEKTNEEDVSQEEEDVESSESDSKETSEESNTNVAEDTSKEPTEPYKASEDTLDEEEVDDKAEVNYKDEYEKLLAPFKANGKEMRVESIDDARTLMQMGANYNKKMAALKPSLKVVKLLDKHDLLDESKIGFLIDLSKKDPEAIKKLMKDGNLDPLDLDMDEEKYTPTNYTISDTEVELDSVLEEIKDTPSFQTTADIVGNKWDEPSRKVVMDNPGLLKVINGHVEDGIYDQIMTVVERERMLGKLAGLSDIEAYKTVGDAINAQGGFQTQPQSTSQSPSNNQATSKLTSNLKDKKKAASSTKSKSTTKANNDFNPLSMSDEEFEKEFSSKFI